jgi:CheY-like chemotaxis protein
LKRLVVVEDDESAQRTTAIYFERAGWSVARAASFAEAIECLQTPFDALICDLHLSPGRKSEGLDVLEAARQTAPTAPLVLLSGDGTADLGDVRPDAVLQKPVRLPALEKLVSQLIAQRS